MIASTEPEIRSILQMAAASNPLPAMDPNSLDDPECECQDVERCPVHFGYD
jgi:hypothetical protein